MFTKLKRLYEIFSYEIVRKWTILGYGQYNI